MQQQLFNANPCLSKLFALAMMILSSNFVHATDSSKYLQTASLIIKKFEKCKLKPYYDSGGHLTSGFGFKHSKKTFKNCQQAESILFSHLRELDAFLSQHIHVELTANQRAAILSLVYNIGTTNFKKSKMLKLINERKFSNVKQQWLQWVYVKQSSSRGLKIRRIEEIQLFQN